MKLFKKVLASAFALGLVLTLTACGTKEGSKTPATDGNNTVSESSDNTYELALITDVGTIDDKSFNQGSWEGLEQYGKEFGLTYKYYQPAEKSDTAYLTQIDLAVKAGAKIIVCPGFLFEVPIFTAQTKYPDVKFIILDGAPHNGDYNNVVADNTHAIFYAEQEAGFLAGYGIVKEGYTKLGFMGGIAVPAVINFGYGFVQGAEYAAEELGLADGSLEVKYTYVGNFDATPENLAIAASWYNDGTEVIFACGGAVGNSVMKAAETANKFVVGVDVDQSSESATVVTSSMKNLSKSVYDAITEFYAGTFPGGVISTLDAKVEGVQLPMETSKFTKFTQEEYNAIYKQIVDGTIEIKNNTVGDSATALETTKVKVVDVK